MVEPLRMPATLDSIRVLMEGVDEAATDDGPALDAMPRFITAAVSIELATLEWVWWWNNQRLHAELDMRTPIEAENAYYGDLESAQPAPAGQGSR
jgi:hypothetical protein